jgi:hypothetical protein
MMFEKRRRAMKWLLTTVMLLGLGAATATAQPAMGINIYAGGGIAIPSSDLNDIGKTGYHGAVAVGISPVQSIETAARFAYYSYSLKDGGDEKFKISEYGLDIRANLAAPGINFWPYALVGGGFAKIDFTPSALDPSFTGVKPETKLFYCIGGGVKVYVLPKLNLFLEGRYAKLSVSDYNLDYLPISVGLNLYL